LLSLSLSLSLSLALYIAILTIQEHHMETQPNAIGFVAASIRMHSLETLTLNKKIQSLPLNPTSKFY
jgi:hypothetical protein